MAERRAVFKSYIDQVLNYVKSSEFKMDSLSKLKVKLELLKDIWKELNGEYASLIGLAQTFDAAKMNEKLLNEGEDIYIDAKSLLMQRIEELNATAESLKLQPASSTIMFKHNQLIYN